MANIFDYIHWRGDLSFRHSPFNIVDSLILTRFSYLPFDDIVTDEPITIQQASKLFFQADKHLDDAIIMQEDIELLRVIAQSRRFKKLKIHHYSNLIDVSKQLQFSAITIQLNANTSYVAFRGTDLTLIGWIEDLNMAFETQISAQRESLNYLKKVQPYLRSQIILGGHSKGGNLAVYASAFTTKQIQETIKEIHDFDGPGFNEILSDDPHFQVIQDRIISYTPETSIVGSLLYSPTTPILIKSSVNGFAEHDTYTWQVTATDIEKSDKMTRTSQQTSLATAKLLDKLSLEERRIVVNTLYNLLTEAGITDIRDIKKGTTQKLAKIVKNYNSLDASVRSLIEKSFGNFIRQYLPNFNPFNTDK